MNARLNSTKTQQVLSQQKGHDLLDQTVEYQESLTVKVSEAKSSTYTIDVTVVDKDGNNIQDVLLVFPKATSIKGGHSKRKGNILPST